MQIDTIAQQPVEVSVSRLKNFNGSISEYRMCIHAVLLKGICIMREPEFSENVINDPDGCYEYFSDLFCKIFEFKNSDEDRELWAYACAILLYSEYGRNYLVRQMAQYAISEIAIYKFADKTGGFYDALCKVRVNVRNAVKLCIHITNSPNGEEDIQIPDA